MPGKNFYIMLATKGWEGPYAEIKSGPNIRTHNCQFIDNVKEPFSGHFGFPGNILIDRIFRQIFDDNAITGMKCIEPDRWGGMNGEV